MESSEWFEAIAAGDYQAIQDNAALFAGAKNDEGLTGLMLAVRSNNPEMVKLLIGQELSETNADGDPVLVLAAQWNAVACIPALLPEALAHRGTNSRTPLMAAAGAGSIDALRILYFYYGDEIDDYGHTALDYAVKANNQEAVQILLHDCPFDNVRRKEAAERARDNNCADIADWIAGTINEPKEAPQDDAELIQEKEAEIEELSAQLERARSAEAALNGSVAQITEELKQMREEHFALVQTHEESICEINLLKEQLESTKDELARAQEGNDTITSQPLIDNSELEMQLANQAAKQTELEAENNNLAASNDVLLCKVKVLEDKLLSAENHLQEKLRENGANDAELEAKKMEVETLRNTLEETIARCSSLEKELEAAKEHANRTDKIDDVFKAIVDVESAIDHRGPAGENIKNELEDLKQERDELQVQVQTQETQLQLFKGKLERLTAKNENTEQKYKSLETELKLQTEQMNELQELLRTTAKKLRNATAEKGTLGKPTDLLADTPPSTESKNVSLELAAAKNLILELQQENARLRGRAAPGEAADCSAEKQERYVVEDQVQEEETLVRSSLIDMNVAPIKQAAIDLEVETGDAIHRTRKDDYKSVEDHLQQAIDEKNQILAALADNLAHSKSQESVLKKQKEQLDEVVARVSNLERENQKLKKATRGQHTSISRKVRSVSAAAKVVTAAARIANEDNFSHDIVVKALIDTTNKLEEQIDNLADENEKLKYELGDAMRKSNDRATFGSMNKESARSCSKLRSRSRTSSSKHVSSPQKSLKHVSNVDGSRHTDTASIPSRMMEMDGKERNGLKATFGLSGEQASALQEARLATYTPLMRAIMKGKTTDIEAALEYAGQVAPDGKTALMLAAEYNRVSFVKLLIDKEAGIKDPYGQMAIHIALQRGHYEVAEQLRKIEGLAVEPIERVNGTRTQLMTAAENNDVYAVWSLIPTQGALQDAEGITALMLAAGAGHKQIVALLIGSEAKIQTAWGTTALMWACQFGHIDCVRMLVPKEIRLRDRRGRSALHYATEAARHTNADTKKAIEVLLRQHIA